MPKKTTKDGEMPLFASADANKRSRAGSQQEPELDPPLQPSKAARVKPAEPAKDATKAKKAPSKRKPVTKEQRLEMLRHKAKVLEMEKKNYSAVFLIEADNGFWTIVGHSVVLYSWLVAERVGRKRPNILMDSDRATVRSEHGIIAISDIEKLRKDLEKSPLDMKLETVEPWLMKIDLKVKVSEEEFKSWARERDAKWERIEKMITPTVVWPQISTTSKNIIRLSEWIATRLHRPMRDSVGQKIIDAAVDILIKCDFAGYGQELPIDALQCMLDDVNTLRALYDVVASMRSADENKLMEVLLEMDVLERQAQKLIKKYLQEENANLSKSKSERETFKTITDRDE